MEFELTKSQKEIQKAVRDFVPRYALAQSYKMGSIGYM